MARKCGYCNQEGHNARTCPKKAADKAAANVFHMNQLLNQLLNQLPNQLLNQLPNQLLKQVASTSSTKKTRMCGFCKKHGHNKENLSGA